MLNIGLIGVGHLGKIHLKLLKEIPSFNVIGIFDINVTVAEKAAKEYNVPFFKNVEELIEKSDALDIVTPTISHFEYAKQVIKKRKHIFIEKPVTTTLEEGEILLELSREADIKIQVGHVERFNPAFLGAQKHIKNPMFIEAHRLALFNPRGTDVSVVLDLMIHDIDIILKTVHSNIKKIYASGVAVVSETPDICNARIEFDNGCVANLTASRLSMKNMRKMRFFQSNAYISVDFLDKKSEILRLKELPNDYKPDEFDLVIPILDGTKYKKIEMEVPEVGEVNSIKMELSEFAQSIITNSTTAVTIDEACNALAVAYDIIDKIK